MMFLQAEFSYYKSNHIYNEELHNALESLSIEPHDIFDEFKQVLDSVSVFIYK